MSASSRRRKRKVRRQQRAAQRHGRAAKPRHVGRSGRTGGMHAKKTPSKQAAKYEASAPRSITEAVTCTKCGARPGERHDHGALSR